MSHTESNHNNQAQLTPDEQTVHAEAHTLSDATPNELSDGVESLLDITHSLTYQEDGSSRQDEQETDPAHHLVLGGQGAADKGLVEEPLSEDVVYEGAVVSVNRMRAKLPDGNVAERDIVRHPGAVAIVALDDDGRIALVRQWRAALGRVTVEIPAGKLKLGEDPLTCAHRELAEETGFRAQKMAYLTSIATAAGFCDEMIHIYMATGLTFEGAHPDADEFLQVDLVEISELIDAVLDGQIEDAKTVVGALAVDAIARRLTPEDQTEDPFETQFGDQPASDSADKNLQF